ncbi:hypothetical protein A2U01_0061207, partial [Trifolium medium]|nr:hypothetical protein [Trifolium medium]
MDVTFLESETYFSAPICNSPLQREIQSQEQNWQCLLTSDSVFDNQNPATPIGTNGNQQNLVEVHDASVVSNDNVVEDIEIEDPPSPVPNDQSLENILE